MNLAIFSPTISRPEDPERRKRRRPLRTWSLCQRRYKGGIDNVFIQYEGYESDCN
jgi:hypothetical protein